MAVTLLDAEGKFTQAQIKPIIANRHSEREAVPVMHYNKTTSQ